MKHLLLLMIFLFCFNPIAKADEVIVQVTGMTCEACVETMDHTFSKQDNVKNVAVNLEDQTITIDTVDGQNLTDEKIKELVEWGGYDLVSITKSE